MRARDLPPVGEIVHDAIHDRAGELRRVVEVGRPGGERVPGCVGVQLGVRRLDRGGWGVVGEEG